MTCAGPSGGWAAGPLGTAPEVAEPDRAVRRQVAAALTLVALLTGCGGGSPTPTTTQGSVLVGGRQRTFTVLAPAHPDGSTVLALHGFNESVAALRQTSDLDRLAREGVTVVYVDGYQASWDAGTCCGSAVVQRVDDLAALRAVARRVVHDHGLDPRRVVLAGHSNGAFLAYRAACEDGATWAAYVVVSGSRVVADCSPHAPETLVVWQGLRDTIVPVAGRQLDAVHRLPGLAESTRPFSGVAGVTLTVVRDPQGTHDWPGGAFTDRAWLLVRGARAAAGV